MLPEQVDAEFSVLAFRDTGVGSPMNCLPVNPSDATSRPRLTESVAIPSSMSSVLPKAGEVSSRLSEPECLVVLEVSDSGVGRVIDLSQNKYLPRVKVSRRPEVSPVEVKRPEVSPVEVKRPEVSPNTRGESLIDPLHLAKELDPFRLAKELHSTPPLFNPEFEGERIIWQENLVRQRQLGQEDYKWTNPHTVNDKGLESIQADGNIPGYTFRPTLEAKQCLCYNFIDNLPHQSIWYRLLNFPTSLHLYEYDFLNARSVAWTGMKNVKGLKMVGNHVRNELLMKYGQVLTADEVKFFINSHKHVLNGFIKHADIVEFSPFDTFSDIFSDE